MQEKIKVIEVIPDLRKRAGAEVFVHDLCKYLSFNCFVDLTLVLLWDDFDQSFKDIESLNVKIYSCHKHKGIDFRASRKFKRIIKKINPDIIHTHRSILPTYFLAFGVAKKKWKLIHTYHSIAEKEAPKLTRILQKWYLKRNLIFPVGISDLVSKSISKHYSISKVKTIYNGREFLPIMKAKKIKYDLISVIRFTEEKNLFFMLNVFDKLLSINPSLRFVMVGDGELFNEIKSDAERRKIGYAITFTGQVSNVNAYLCESKIFLLTSLYEGNPISVLEAMHCGLPVVSSNVGGVPDIIKHGVNGYLCEVNNLQDFILVISSLLSSRKKIDDIGINNIRDVEKFFIKNTAIEYFNYFVEILNADNIKN